MYPLVKYHYPHNLLMNFTDETNPLVIINDYLTAHYHQQIYL